MRHNVHADIHYPRHFSDLAFDMDPVFLNHHYLLKKYNIYHISSSTFFLSIHIDTIHMG